MAQYYNSTNNYQSIYEYILKGRSKIERKVANNTIARIEDDKIIIKYHSSDIVELTESTIKLDSCGYKTYTTKERLNWYIPTPYSLYQKDHVWYVWNYEDKKTYVFQDGIVFIKMQDRTWNLDLTTCAKQSEIKRIKSTKRKINNYVNKYIKALTQGELKKPSEGDCWYCLFQTEDNISLGQATNNIDHLESHFDENYLVPSLLMNAIRFYPMSPFSNGILGDIWFNPDKPDISWGVDIFKDQARSSLKKFLYREFNIA